MNLTPLRCRLFSLQGSHYAILLGLLTLLAAGLRLYKLGDYPGGFGQDESAQHAG